MNVSRFYSRMVGAVVTALFALAMLGAFVLLDGRSSDVVSGTANAETASIQSISVSGTCGKLGGFTGTLTLDQAATVTVTLGLFFHVPGNSTFTDSGLRATVTFSNSSTGTYNFAPFTNPTANTYRIQVIDAGGLRGATTKSNSVQPCTAPTPTATPTNTPTPTPTKTPTATPTNTPTNTPTATPTSTPTATPTSTPTATPTNTPTPTPPGKTFTKTVLSVDGSAPVGTPPQAHRSSMVVFQIVATGAPPSQLFSATEHVPANTTFVNLQPAGLSTSPALPVAGPFDVTINNIASDSAGSFTLEVTLQISSSAPCGSLITNVISKAAVPDAAATVQVICP